MRSFALVALAALAAGCASPSLPSEPADVGPARAAPLPIDLSECAIVEILLPGKRDAAEALLPGGFTLPGSSPTVVVIPGAVSCANGGSRAFFAIGVQVDDALRDENVTADYWIAEHHAVDGEPYAAAIAAIGANVTLASISTRAGAIDAGFEIEAPEWTHRVTSAPGNVGDPAAPLRNGGGWIREWFAAEGGYAFLDTRSGATQSSAILAGVMEPGAGSPAAGVLAGMAGLTVVSAGASYAEARVGFVPWP